MLISSGLADYQANEYCSSYTFQLLAFYNSDNYVWLVLFGFNLLLC